MSILSTIGKIVGIGAAPFTGGLSLIPTLAGAAGDIMGGIAKGRAAERGQTDAYNAAQDQGALVRANMADNQARTNYNAVPNLYTRALLGDVTANMQPLAYGPDGKLTGGISSALFSDATREAGRNMSADAVKRMFSSNPVGLPDIPQPTARQAPTGLDKFLNIGSLVGGSMGAIRNATTPPPKGLTIDDLRSIFGGGGAAGGAAKPTATLSRVLGYDASGDSDSDLNAPPPVTSRFGNVSFGRQPYQPTSDDLAALGRATSRPRTTYF
jgi:hypothetical protein